MPGSWARSNKSVAAKNSLPRRNKKNNGTKLGALTSKRAASRKGITISRSSVLAATGLPAFAWLLTR
eukprot:8386299-Pyramimonas_sp.AAC.1